jgi:hypothetical protein
MLAIFAAAVVSIILPSTRKILDPFLRFLARAGLALIPALIGF